MFMYKKFCLVLRSFNFADLYFLVQWEEKDQDDGESLYDVLPSKAIIDDDPLAVVEGHTVCVSFKKKTYPALIVGRGMLLFFIFFLAN